MDKEYLGLGIAFKGIDKGLNKSLTDATKGFEKTTESLDGLEKAAAFGSNLFSGIGEGLKMLSLARIGSTLEEVQQGINGTDKTFNSLSLTLDTIGAKFATTFDPAMANRLNANLMKTMATTGITADEAERLALGMTNFGRSAQEASDTLPFMGQMVGLLGVSAEKVSAMFGQGLSTLRATPQQMEQLVKETVKLGKAYNLTDQVEALPEIFESVTKNAARFGLVTADAAIRTTMGLSTIVAQFRKVGKSQQEAISATVGFNDKLSDMQNSIRDMEVGLGPMDESVTQLAQALSLAGMTDPFSVIKEGFKDPAGLMKTITEQIKGLDDFTKQGVTQRLRRIFGDDVTNLMSTYSDDVKGAVTEAEKKSKVMGTADQEFDKTTKAMMNTLSVQEKLTDTAKELLQVQIDFANKKDVIAQLQRERNAFNFLSAAVGSADSALGALIRTLDLFKKTGVAGIFGSDWMTKIAVVGGMLGALIFPLTSLLGLFNIFKVPLMMFAKLLALPFKPVIGLLKLMLSPLGRAIGLVKDLWVYARVLFLEFTTGPLKAMVSLARLAIQGIGAVTMALVRMAAAFVFGNPIALFIAGVLALGAAIVAIVYYWDDIKAAAMVFFNWAGTALANFTTLIMNTWNSIHSLSDVWDIVKTSAVAALQFISNIFTMAYQGLRDGLLKALDFVGALKETFSKEGVAGVFNFLVDAAQAAIDKIFILIKNAFKSMTLPEWVSKFVYGSEGKQTKESDVIPNNVIAFPQSKESVSPNVPVVPTNASGQTPMPSNVIPLLTQQGVPQMNNPMDVPFEQKRNVGDENFQAVLDELRGLRQSLVDALKQIGDKDVKVEIRGDMARFIRAVRDDDKTTAGSRGIGHAVNR